MRHQRRAGYDSVSPVLKETQKCLPKFVTSHLPSKLRRVLRPAQVLPTDSVETECAEPLWYGLPTPLILEAGSFDVNQV